MANHLTRKQVLDTGEIHKASTVSTYVKSVIKISFALVATNIWAKTFSAMGMAY